MTTRSIKQVIKAITTSDGAGVKLFRSIGQQQTLRLDPFLMLDEFSSMNADDYIAGFPDHPHRGFETITYMLEGHMLHRDHLGNQGDLKSGGAQWMTAGRGIIHSEMPQQSNGYLHGFQLWINLPAQQKMQPATYQDLQPEQIPTIKLSNGGTVKIIAGKTNIENQNIVGPIQSFSTQPLFLDIRLPADAEFGLAIEPSHHAVVYPYQGQLDIEKQTLVSQCAGLLSAGEQLVIQSGKQTVDFLLLSAKPLHEPIVQYGPFVMNTRDEIEQAITDYRNGRLISG